MKEDRGWRRPAMFSTTPSTGIPVCAGWGAVSEGWEGVGFAVCVGVCCGALVARDKRAAAAPVAACAAVGHARATDSDQRCSLRTHHLTLAI